MQIIIQCPRGDLSIVIRIYTKSRKATGKTEPSLEIYKFIFVGR
jgi:hypothetical protein